MLPAYFSLLLLLGDRVSTYLGEANSLVAFKFAADAGLIAFGVDQHHVRNVDRGLLFGDAALDVSLRVRLDVLLDHHDVLDQEAVLVGNDAKYAAALALVFSCD